MSAATPALTVDKMHKSFGQLEVLKGMSLTAQRRRRDLDSGLVRLGQEHVSALHQSA